MKKLFTLLALASSLMSCGCGETPIETPNDKVTNVIFMIGDGMGLAQASMLMVENEYKETAFDRAQNIALIKTYSANNRVTDSAAAGTALASGTKTNNKMIGLTPQLDTCYSLAHKAHNKGLATGIVVSCGIQHATPAAFYAHVENRDDNYNITRQLADSKLDLAIGGGSKYFDEKLEGVKFSDIAKSNGFNIVSSMNELNSACEGRILGLFEQGHIKSMTEGRGNYLSDATEIALERLKSDKDGFFLMVEGSQIDWECHDNNAERTLLEVADFEKCVNLAMDFADKNPGTLVVITADHETGGLSMVSNNSDFTTSDSGLSYKFSTGNHSGILVPVYTYGSCARAINGVMENTELSNKIAELLAL